MKKIITVALLALMAVSLVMPVGLPVLAENQSDEFVPGSSEINWLLWLESGIEQSLSPEIEERMLSLYTPELIDCGEVQVLLKEVYYDGERLLTAAAVYPTDPGKTLIVPSSAGTNDFVSGGHGENRRDDTRTFEQAAKEDGKRLFMVDVKLKEYVGMGVYMGEHRQDANDISTIFSGTTVMPIEPASHLDMTWDIWIREIDVGNGIIDATPITKEIPVKITNIGPTT